MVKISRELIRISGNRKVVNLWTILCTTTSWQWNPSRNQLTICDWFARMIILVVTGCLSVVSSFNCRYNSECGWSRRLVMPGSQLIMKSMMLLVGFWVVGYCRKSTYGHKVLRGNVCLASWMVLWDLRTRHCGRM